MIMNIGKQQKDRRSRFITVIDTVILSNLIGPQL